MKTPGGPLISIIINNYNYDRYIREAINSAIDQTYEHIEIVVVDDGSTDNSGFIINEFTNQIKPIFKPNGGQGSAFNTGFNECTGAIIIFLDADDCLLPNACETVAQYFDDNTSKAHWPLWVINEHSINSNSLTPKDKLPEGDLLKTIMECGPISYLSPPTSGNAWSRKFLEQVLPMPEEAYTISADSYLFMLAPLYGQINSITEPLSLYRLHGKNNFRGKPLVEALLQAKVRRYDTSCSILCDHLSKMGYACNVALWKSNSWLNKLYASLCEIKHYVPEDHTLILADGDEWQIVNEFANRKIVPFAEKENRYWGLPENDDHAIFEIKRQIQKNAQYIFFAWPVFWILDHYKKLSTYLSSQHECLIRNERLIGYKLSPDV